VVVEEAGEVLEAHVLAALSRATEHLIMVGDHEQLRPKPNRYELQAMSGRRFDLDISLFERLARTPTFPRATLATQRRMRPDISRCCCCCCCCCCHRLTCCYKPLSLLLPLLLPPVTHLCCKVTAGMLQSAVAACASMSA
jgi:hypothetical protein